MVELKEPLATLWRGKDAFAEVKKLNGEVFRELETRRTLRFELMKVYFGMPLRKILSLEQNLLNMASVKAERIKERTQRKGL